jgi:hypothetical protein
MHTVSTTVPDNFVQEDELNGTVKTIQPTQSAAAEQTEDRTQISAEGHDIEMSTVPHITLPPVVEQQSALHTAIEEQETIEHLTCHEAPSAPDYSDTVQEAQPAMELSETSAPANATMDESAPATEVIASSEVPGNNTCTPQSNASVSIHNF